nr:hypothetical protein [Anaerofilum sp. An201]
MKRPHPLRRIVRENLNLRYLLLWAGIVAVIAVCAALYWRQLFGV